MKEESHISSFFHIVIKDISGLVLYQAESLSGAILNLAKTKITRWVY